MNRTQDILQAIADALTATRQEAAMLVALVLGAILVLILAVTLQRMMTNHRTARAFRDRFEREIRRRDLTIRQLDVVDVLAHRLHDPSKKYLLLTNQNTFQHCVKAAGKLKPPMDDDLKALAAKLGYGGADSVALELGSFAPKIGAAVKLEVPGASQRALAQVKTGGSGRFTVQLESNPGFTRGTMVFVYASHPSGMVVAEGEITRIERSEAEVVLNRPFAEPTSRHQLEHALKVFVRGEGESGDPAPSNLGLLWPTGAMMDNPDRRFRVRDDIQIVLRRNHSRWVVINAEVVGVRKRRRLMKVRFSHLSREARAEILGKMA